MQIKNESNMIFLQSVFIWDGYTRILGVVFIEGRYFWLDRCQIYWYAAITISLDGKCIEFVMIFLWLRKGFSVEIHFSDLQSTWLLNIFLHHYCLIFLSGAIQISVSAFKEKIAVQSGVPVGQQRLIFRGKVLKDDHLLSEYSILPIASLVIFICSL